ncbi:DMT family transporter [Thiomonas sp. X19]|uniref:DMT family transporter n=1 Tax=Thiomonas sp. X19 TaxID=1050370 RepID=UPI000DD68370|nr:DMT family transporter [Thiomonas sp. X19]
MDFLVLLLGGAVLGLAGVFVHLADTSANIGPFASAFWRMAIAAPLLLAWVAWQRQPVTIVALSEAAAEPPGTVQLQHRPARNAPPALLQHWPTRWLTVFTATMFALDLLLFHVAAIWTTVGNATLESNFAPVVIALAFWAITRVAPSSVYVTGLVAALAGASLMIGPNFHDPRALLGDACGLTSALFYAAYQVGVQQARQRLATAPLMAAVTLLAALVLWPFAWFEGRLWPTAAIGWVWLVGLALLVQIGGQVVIAYAVRRLNPALSSVGLLVQPAMAVVYAWVLLGQALAGWQIAGAALVLVGIYLARRGM